MNQICGLDELTRRSMAALTSPLVARRAREKKRTLNEGKGIPVVY